MTEEIKEMLWKIKRQNTYDDIGYFKTPLSNDDADKLLNYITNLQNKYDKTLQLLADFNTPCETDCFMDMNTDYCEINCSNDEEQFKKCWDKFIEWKLKDE